jgi:hypothetical protein
MMLTGRINWRHGATVLGAASSRRRQHRRRISPQLPQAATRCRSFAAVPSSWLAPAMFAGVTYSYFVINATSRPSCS